MPGHVQETCSKLFTLSDQTKITPSPSLTKAITRSPRPPSINPHHRPASSRSRAARASAAAQADALPQALAAALDTWLKRANLGAERRDTRPSMSVEAREPRSKWSRDKRIRSPFEANS